MLVIIDNYDSFTYNLYQLISGYYPDIRVIRNDVISVEQLKQLNPKGIIISPGPGTPDQAGICIDLIKSLSDSIPILGVCLGHQAITKAFGGEVVRSGEIFHGKPSSIRHRKQGLFRTLPSPFQAGRYHSLIARKETLPSVLAIHAETDNGIVMAIKHRQRPCYGLQFHPESILTPFGKEIVESFLKKEVL